MGFHDTLKKRKYRLLYTARSKGNPGPNGPSQELIDAIVEMKRRNSRFGAFPDGTSALMLAAAKPRHIGGTQWGTKRYLRMDLLRDLDAPETHVA